MRQRILRAVGVIFNRNGGHLFAGGPELVHVAPRDHGEQSREGSSHADLTGSIAGAREDLGNLRSRLGSHLLHASGEDDIVHACRYGRYRMKKSRPARGASRLKTRARYRGNSDSRCNIGRQVILADKRRSGEVAEVKSLYL